MEHDGASPNPRSRARRQSDSARRYLDVEATTPALRTTVELAARSAGFAIAQLNVLDETTQYTLVNIGGPPVSTVRRSGALCDDVVLSEKPAIVTLNCVDATERQRNILDSIGVASYASVPLKGREGLVIGTLCLLDRMPRELSHEQIRKLEQYGSVLEEQLDLHRRVGSSPAKLDNDHGLSAALDAGQIVPWFQSVVDIRSGAVIGFEALARWQHPTRGLVSPVDFVPFAESSELIIDVDLEVLRLAVKEVEFWHRYRPELRLSVNLSGRHLAHTDAIAQLGRVVASSSVPPKSISLELTETSSVVDGPSIRRHIDDVHALGFRVLLDDFGSGWSSLERLVTLEPDGIKIDAQLTRFIDTERGRALLRAIAAIARELKMSMVIEGVETREQADTAIELGCTLAQGFLWSRPRSAESIRRTLSGVSTAAD